MTGVTYKQLSGNKEIDSLINNYQKYIPIWAPVNGVTKITYSFSGANIDVSAYGNLASKPVAWKTDEQVAIRAALGEWAKYANIEFVEVSNSGAGGDIRITKADLAYGIGGLTAAPGTKAIAGDILISKAVNVKSGDGFSVMVHEIGHSLGLQHPFANNSSATMKDTVMAYSHSGFDYNTTGLMSTDIKAIQYLYGAKDTSQGNDVYKFTKDGYEAFTIHDTAGIDTIDLSSLAKAPTIDLREGSVLGIGIKAMVIDKGAVIENAIGTNGADTFIGNAANNTFDGKGGTDTVLYDGKKSEYQITKFSTMIKVAHGTDVDTLLNIETVKFADSTIDLLKYVPSVPQVVVSPVAQPATAVTVTPLVTTTIAVEKVVLVPSNTASNVAPVVTAGDIKVPDAVVAPKPATKDCTGFFTGPTKLTFNGGAGNDVLQSYGTRVDVANGNKGDDWLYGYGGNDVFFLSSGKDFLFGGSGSDSFIFTGAFKDTKIKDFAPGVDKLVFEDSYFTALKGGITKENVKLSIHEGVQADTAEQHLIYATWSGQLYYDADGNGAGRAEVVGMIMSGFNDVNYRDFIVM